MTHDCEKDSGALLVHAGRLAHHAGRAPFSARRTWTSCRSCGTCLRGDMSLVGPRPERAGIHARAGAGLPHYRDRLAVRPGVTGLAQVQLPPDTDLDSVRRKLAYDLYYIRYRGFWLDLRLIACTAVHMAGVPTGRCAVSFSMPRPEAVEVAYEEHGRPRPPVRGVTSSGSRPQTR